MDIICEGKKPASFSGVEFSDQRELFSSKPEKGVWDREEGLHVELQKEKLESEKQSRSHKNSDHHDRKKYTNKLYHLALCCLLTVYTFVFLSGLTWLEKPKHVLLPFFNHAASNWPFTFILSDKLAMALVTAVSVNVLGLLAIALKCLFRKDENKYF